MHRLVKSEMPSLHRERGAVATILVILLTTGVAFGALALSLDVGQMMMEKRQLQNGADSTAMYLARSCASGSCDVSASNAATTTILGDNTTTHSNDFQTRCYFHKPGAVSDPGCSGTDGSATGTFADCSPLPTSVPSGVPYVQVATRSKLASAGGLQNWIAPLIGGSKDSNVGACSRAAWGPPNLASGTLPLTISACEWYHATNDASGYPNTWAGYSVTPEVGITLNDTTHSNDCKAWQGHNFPGGFGFLQMESTGCTATVDDNNWVGTAPGLGKNKCINAYVGKIVLLPIFDCVSTSKTFCDDTGNGGNAYYHILTFAALYLTAVDLPGDKGNVTGYPGATASAQCNKKCLYGWFIKGYTPSQGQIDPNAPDFGAVLVIPAG